MMDECHICGRDLTKESKYYVLSAREAVLRAGKVKGFITTYTEYSCVGCFEGEEE